MTTSLHLPLIAFLSSSAPSGLSAWGNHNNAVFEIFGVSFKVFYKEPEQHCSYLDFCNIDKMTFIVNTEERLICKSFAECCGNSGNSTASLELIKVFNNKPMTYFYTGVFNVFF